MSYKNNINYKDGLQLSEFGNFANSNQSVIVPPNVEIPLEGNVAGAPGISAYQTALNNGFVGTEAQWLVSLKGAPGTGTPGAPGISAYQTALNNGFVGTEAQWLVSLKGAPGTGTPGAPGASAYQTALNNGFVGTEAQWLVSLKGAPGTGTPGVSAYQSALNGGFVGTEAQFNAKLSESNLPLSGGKMTGAITAIRETKVDLTTNVIDMNLANVFVKNLTSNISLSVINLLGSGNVNSFILEVKNTGAYTINWWNNIKWSGGNIPIPTSNGTDIFGFYTYDNGATWRGIVMSEDNK